MRESDVRSDPRREKARHLPDVSPATERADAKDASGRAKRDADDDWQALATEDPAFFIKTSDTV